MLYAEYISVNFVTENVSAVEPFWTAFKGLTRKLVEG